jgi:hypothetical protein
MPKPRSHDPAAHPPRVPSLVLFAATVAMVVSVATLGDGVHAPQIEIRPAGADRDGHTASAAAARATEDAVPVEDRAPRRKEIAAPPAPAPLSAEAAGALALLQAVANARTDTRARGARGGALGPPASLSELDPLGRATAGGYLFAPAQAGPDGAPAEPWRGRITGPTAAPFCCYAWPDTDTAAHVFFLDGSGKILCSDNRLQRYASGLRTPAPRAAFGADGAVWVPVSSLPAIDVEIVLVDRDGRAVEGAVVALTSPAALGALSQTALVPSVELHSATAAGVGQTDRAGRLSLRGPQCERLHVAVYVAGTWLALDPSCVARSAAGWRVEVDAAAARTARANANESAAIATLKNIASAQYQCQASGFIDADGDGAGEFGFLAELAGALPVRGDQQGGVSEKRMSPPVLSAAFGRIEAGCALRSGYFFRVFLPDAGGSAVAEAAAGGAEGVVVGADRAERTFVVYAWPVERGTSGKRAFAIDQNGDVLACRNDTACYSGAEGGPLPLAAARTDVPATLGAGLAANAVARDGETWVVVN